MDLLEKMQKEIAYYHLTSKLEIAYYLYLRTGELFNYNPLWEYASSKEAIELRSERVDIHNVTDYTYICTKWAYMYKDLLNAFGIPAEVINKSHAKVLFWCEQGKCIADITKKYYDIMAIKFGLSLQYFTKENGNLDLSEINKKAPFKDIFRTEEVLFMLKQEIDALDLSKDNEIQVVIYFIENIMNWHRRNIGFISGSEYIRYLFLFFLGYVPFSTNFYDKKAGIYFKVYTMMQKGVFCYYAYKKMENGYYEFHEVSQNYALSLVKKYNAIDIENLEL